MTEPCEEQTGELRELPPEPRWYPWTIKLLLGVTAFLATASLALLLIYVAPTIKANADTANALARSSAVERRQDACYDKFTARVTDGNSSSIAATLANLGTIGTLITDLAVPMAERNPAAVPADIAAIKAAAERGAAALAVYDKANDARTEYSDAGRPLPCPLS